MVNTMFGEVVSEFDDCVVIDHKGIPVWLTKDEFEIIKFPKLNEDEWKYYNELKGVKNGDKRGMVSYVNFDVMNLGLDFKYESYYRIIEAIIKGGCNH